MDAGRSPAIVNQIPIDVRRFPWIPRLSADYAHNFAPLARFFTGNPADRQAWRDAIERAQKSDRERDVIAEVLAAQQARREAPAAARAAAERLRDPRCVAIVTGQQAGLFGGPLFTLLKAITALLLAERVTREYQTPAVAVFWIDAEDHDWEEVRACSVLGSDLEPRSVSLGSPPGGGNVPVATIRLDESAESAVTQLGATLSPSTFTADLIAQIGECYRPGVGMADAFGRLLETVLGPRGLVVFDSSDTAAKPLAAQVFERELREPGRTTELATAAGAELTKLGYHAQVSPHPGTVALFHLEGGRQPIRRRGDDLVVGDRPVPREALRSEAASEPAHFSPNVLLRPIVQDSLFPTLCYVPGPSELSYLAQLKGVYEHFGVPMPLLHPRASATILDSGGFRFLSRYDLPFEELQPQDEAALNRLLAAQLPSSVETSLDETSKAIQERMALVIQSVPNIDPTLEGTARSTLVRMENDLQTLRSKIIQAAKRRHETLRRQFISTRAQTFPGGEPQERAIGFVYFQNQYGPGLIDRLFADLSLDFGQHWVITI